MLSDKDGHRVEITFADGLYAKLICPESGCKPATLCSECCRHADDTETPACPCCPRPDDECWVKTWFDNCSAEELLAGKLTVDIDPQWDGDQMWAEIGSVSEVHGV